MTTTEAAALLMRVTQRLFIALGGLFVAALVLIIWAALSQSQYVVPPVVVAGGFIGGFVGLQRRLKELTVPDLQLIADSWVYTCLSPLVGGVLALLIYVLFLSGLLAGDLFPHFVPDSDLQGPPGFSLIFKQHSEHFSGYAKLVFWSFVAGFSERFVTDVISRFEGTAVKSLQ
jgi:hypothetical protein